MAEKLTVEQIQERLLNLKMLQEEQAAYQEYLEALIDSLFERHPEEKEKRHEYLNNIANYQKAIDNLIEDIKEAVLEHGETVKGEHFQAVWSKGRTSWETEKLLGLATKYKEILEMKKTGKPSISIKKVK